MPTIVTITALVMGVLCFMLFLWLSLKAQQATATAPAQQMADKASGLTPTSFGELTEMVKALATLSDSLVKAGPALSVLIASILFLTIAAGASGAFVGNAASTATKAQNAGACARGTSTPPGVGGPDSSTK